MIRPGRLVLLGHPVSHSLSPAMQNAALSSAGIPVKYVAEDTSPESLPAALSALAAEGAAGNITIPHKESATRLMSELSAVARTVGAVNTFFTGDGGGLVGDNTDVAGFGELVVATLGEIPNGARFAVVGSGGSAAAVVAAIAAWPGCSAVIHGRNKERAKKLAGRFIDVARVASVLLESAIDADVVVNATPVGLSDEHMPIELSRLPRSAVIIDLVYRPGETAWVRAARAAGRKASGGLAMLVGQGAAAFEIWFGTPPDREAMWREVNKAAGPP